MQIQCPECGGIVAEWEANEYLNSKDREEIYRIQ
jgi:hypothetical protein